MSNLINDEALKAAMKTLHDDMVEAGERFRAATGLYPQGSLLTVPDPAAPSANPCVVGAKVKVNCAFEYGWEEVRRALKAEPSAPLADQ